jgi:hypothetical protein
LFQSPGLLCGRRENTLLIAQPFAISGSSAHRNDAIIISNSEEERKDDCPTLNISGAASLSDSIVFQHDPVEDHTINGAEVDVEPSTFSSHLNARTEPSCTRSESSDPNIVLEVGLEDAYAMLDDDDDIQLIAHVIP